ncbi:hypothetical protein G3570_15580 [Balneolaceae bacterium YR4-1]|uniref:GDSL-like Lipase/Acylhydrolase n=1 Tax=Halalkalibaculum roseum TaxID=2709311 RepID=A0A6M1SSN7_9BACT|nr:SGNH/GDSL hydrolase family protein [Halalkalibaculum roseum]NGP78069.1 hypothetical protein [Halalkalibaculum roseum]
MKFTFKKTSISVLVLLLMVLAGCEDYSSLNLKPIDSGNADYSNYVAVGNSLTAGYQNSSLYASGQQFSFPKQIARQLRIEESFDQPLISDPGIGGRIELNSLNPIGLEVTSSRGTPFNQNQKPFKNLGIPGSILVDYLNPNNQGQLKERSTNPQNPAFNPFYSIVLPNNELAKDAPNIHNQVVAQNPTFVTFWLGNNDVLGYVTSGGQSAQGITDPAVFAQLYQASVQALQATGASVVVYNIPDVTSIPYVFLLRSQLEQQGAITFNEDTQSYQLVTEQGNFDIYISVDGNAEVMRQDDFPTLRAQEFFVQVQRGNIPPPIQPENAIPDNLVLDGSLGDGDPTNSELEQAAAAVQQFNATIASAASSAGFGLVDINAIYNEVITNYQTNGGGYSTNGIKLQPLPGSLFSFDGIHPTNRGASVIANETIKVMNSTFGSSVDLIDVSDIPEGLPVD